MLEISGAQAPLYRRSWQSPNNNKPIALASDNSAYVIRDFLARHLGIGTLPAYSILNIRPEPRTAPPTASSTVFAVRQPNQAAKPAASAPTEVKP
jgi:hypothetical protein